MMNCRRRLLQSQGNEEKFLKYWWSADDDLVGGVWYDRKGSGVNWTAVGNVSKENGLIVTDGDEGYFIFHDYNRILDLGHHFKVVFEGEIKKKTSITKNSAAIIDLGSLTSANKNIGFTSKQIGMDINWKMQGNQSGANLGITNDNLSKQVGAINTETFTSGIFKWGVRDKDNGYDEAYVAYNDDIGVYNVNVPKLSYNEFAKFYLSNCAIYYISRAPEKDYNSILRIKNIKIYVYD